MGSQGENSIHNLPHIADFRLKCCILKEDTKNNISGRKYDFTISPSFPSPSPGLPPSPSPKTSSLPYSVTESLSMVETWDVVQSIQITFPSPPSLLAL
jgi:hypothetical protein